MNTKIDNKKIEKISKALGDPYRIKIMQAVKETRSQVLTFGGNVIKASRLF